MRVDTSKFQYKQLETYKEILELHHIKIKTLIVNIINLVFAFVVGYFLVVMKVERIMFVGIIFMFVVLFIVNIALYSYNNDLYNNLKFSMYINTIGEYIIAITLIIIFQTPSMFTLLFLAYAITAIYQDYKAMITSNLALFVSGVLLVVGFDSIFSIPGSTSTQNNFIIVFLILFVLLLTLSSYILIKRKTFFYNHLAQIKESEIRNMDVLIEIEQKRTKKTLDSEEYYKSLELFSRELSKKIGIENIFSRKIQLLRDLKKYNSAEIIEKYSEYTQDEINELKILELSTNQKIRNLGIKASKTQGINVTRKEIFSESQFKSFKHLNDKNYVKIISFVVFYCLIKIDKPYLKELEESNIKDILLNSEYFYRIDRDIIEIYLENNEVFDTIVNDLLKDRWTYEKNN